MKGTRVPVPPHFTGRPQGRGSAAGSCPGTPQSQRDLIAWCEPGFPLIWGEGSLSAMGISIPYGKSRPQSPRMWELFCKRDVAPF